jgi:outer membrane protein OmpA-like peptidoglycan-associated protein
MVVLRGLLLGGACGVGILGWSAAIDIGNAAIAVKKLTSDSVVVRVADSSAATHMYFGDKTAPSNPAWAAPAKMNPDYQSAGSSASEAPAAETSSAEAPAQAAANDKATTNYYGDKAAPSNPAWAAPAKMNPEYSNAASPAAQPSATTSEPAAAPVRNAAVEACRAALTAAVPSVKLHFAESSYDVPAASRRALKKVAKIIGDCDGVVVEVNAFTDNTGGTESNMKLSERRANAVVKFLTSAGVDASKLKAIGNGESRPITTNSTAEGRRTNRRVEFVVLGQ